MRDEFTNTIKTIESYFERSNLFWPMPNEQGMITSEEHEFNNYYWVNLKNYYFEL